MTINGGKPHNVGDKAQRYEVTYLDPATQERKTFGWSDTLEGVGAMLESIEIHPSFEAGAYQDRKSCHSPPNKTTASSKT